MDLRHKKLIQGNMDELVDVTHRIDDIINLLSIRNTLNNYMVNFLTKFKEQNACKREFYEMIQGRGPLAFNNLLEVLRETRNIRAEKLLAISKLGSYTFIIDQQEEPHNTDFVNNNKSPLIEIDETDSPPESEGLLSVKQHPDMKFMDVDEENHPGGTYRMRSSPRGLVLLINIFTTIGDFMPRRGSNLDYKKVDRLFQELGFEVVKHENLSLTEMREVINMFSRRVEHSTNDCLVVFIMSHGARNNRASGFLYSADGGKIETDWILDQFVNSDHSLSCEERNRKPKLFFFVACRKHEDREPDHKNVRWTKSADEDNNLVSRRTSGDFSYTCSARDHGDSLVVFSTIPGFYSMRDPIHGSWFVNAFCDIVAENGWRYDLITLLGMVDDEVRKKESRYGNQIVQWNNLGFSKKLYFNPHLAEDRPPADEKS